MVIGNCLKSIRDRFVGGDAAGSDKRREPGARGHGQRIPGAVDEAIDGSFLEACRKVVHVDFAQRACCFSGQSDSSFQAGEGEIRARTSRQRARQGEALGVSASGALFDARPAGIPKAEQLGGLVESFTRGVVNRGAEAFVVSDAMDGDKLGVSAGNQQQQVRESELIGQSRGEGMAFEVVDGEQRFARSPGERFCAGQPDDQAPDQARPGGGGDGINLCQLQPCIVQCGGDDPVEGFDMGARCDLRHDAAECGVFLDLRQDDAGAYFSCAIRIAMYHRSSGFIAACLDSQDVHAGLTGLAAIRSCVQQSIAMGFAMAGVSSIVTRDCVCQPAIKRVPVQKSLFLRIGTRGSALALWQAEHVRDELCRVHGVSRDDISIDIIRTSGDRITDRPLSEVGGKGLFTKEIEDALLAGAIDIAVHSAKDMPTELPEGLVLSAFLTREDVRDAFLSPRADRLVELPHGAVVGSASLRRQALIRRLRPDLKVINFRGNVGTRLDKLAGGEVDATLLAYAGLKRLGLESRVTELLDAKSFPPALGQGCVCVESRLDDGRTNTLMSAIDDASARAELTAERAFLGVLDGSCRTPIAGLARAGGEVLSLHGLVAMPDGSRVAETRLEGAPSDAEKLGKEAGRIVLDEAGEDFMAAVRAHG